MNNRLLNIGRKSAAWLRYVGVNTFDDLTQLGAVRAYLKVRNAGFKPGLNFLYALVGAEQGRSWTTLSMQEKDTLVKAVDEQSLVAK